MHGGLQMADLSVNGKTHQVDVDPNTPLLWVLRDSIGLTGTKFGCGIAQCGACTVFLDGRPQRSCALTISALGAAEVTTIEGVAGRETGGGARAQGARDVPRCGQCGSRPGVSA